MRQRQMEYFFVVVRAKCNNKM